jgi:DNA mismatch repair protein MutL
VSTPATGSRIHRLDARTSSRIAAGEVLDRPAAALKELVENALDAGATTIDVTVTGGLDASFAVADDGLGMTGDELPLALERHATSKLEALEDLDRLVTLGFRGEALPSIAEVSRLTLTSRQHDVGAAHTLAVEGGVVGAVTAAARAPGTTVEVKDLFFNTPARRKFLRSSASELRVALRMLTAYALAYPETAFRFTVDGKPRLALPHAASRHERLVGLHGAAFAERMIEVKEERPGFTFEAWLGVPELARVTRDGQTLLVNRRWVQNPTLSAALRHGYGNLIPPGRHPTALMALDVDPATLDVNVHPTKREVRFSREDAVFAFVAQTVARPLARLAPRYVPAGRDLPRPPALGELTRETERQENLFSTARRALTGGGTLLGGTGATDAGGGLRLVGPADAATPTEGEAGAPDEAAAAASEPASSRLPDLWQLHQTYILAPIAGGLLIVDQHAAHERILYEDALERFKTSSTVSQGMLFAIPVELTRDEFDLLLEVEPALTKLGFDLSTLSPPTVLVRAVPAGIMSRDPAGLLRDVLDGLGEQHGRSTAKDEPWDRVAKSFACHAAVRAGDSLSREEMNHLIDQLFATKLPHGDPHGRATYVRVDLHELNQRFGRSD